MLRPASIWGRKVQPVSLYQSWRKCKRCSRGDLPDPCVSSTRRSTPLARQFPQFLETKAVGVYSFLDQERESFVRHTWRHIDDFIIGEIVLSERIGGQSCIKLSAFDGCSENEPTWPRALPTRYQKSAVSIVFAEPLPVGGKMFVNFTQWSFVTKNYCVHSV